MYNFKEIKISCILYFPLTEQHGVHPTSEEQLSFPMDYQPARGSLWYSGRNRNDGDVGKIVTTALMVVVGSLLAVLNQTIYEYS